MFGREGGAKAESRDLALKKIRTFTRDKIGREEIRMWRSNGAKELKNVSSKIVKRRGTTKVGASVVNNAMSFLLTVESISESALARGSNINRKASEETFLVENGTLVKQMRVSDATKHAVTKCGTIVSKLVDNSWHLFVHGSFKSGIVVGIIFFAKSIDATLKWATTTAKSSSESSRRGDGEINGEFRRTVFTCQAAAQSNGEVARRHVVTGQRIKSVNVAECLQFCMKVLTMIGELRS